MYSMYSKHAVAVVVTVVVIGVVAVVVIVMALWCQQTMKPGFQVDASCPSFGCSCPLRRHRRLSQSPRPSAWAQAQRAPPARMADQPPLTIQEWVEVHKVSPAVLRMVLEANRPSATAAAIGATPGLGPNLTPLQDQPPVAAACLDRPEGDTDAQSEPGDGEDTQGGTDAKSEPGDGEGTLLVPTPPDFPPPEKWRAAPLVIGASSAGRSEASSCSGRPTQPMLQSFPKCKRPKLSKQRLRSPERGSLGRP